MLCNQMNYTVLSYFYGWRAGEVLWMHACDAIYGFVLDIVDAYIRVYGCTHVCTSLRQRCYGRCFGWCTSSVVLLGFMDEHA